MCISPTSDNRVRGQVRLMLVKWLSVSETFAITDLDNPDTQTSTQSKSWITGFFLQPLEQLTLNGSLTVSDLDHRSNTVIRSTLCSPPRHSSYIGPLAWAAQYTIIV